MKTLNEIYGEVLENKELTAEYKSLKSAEEQVAFIKKLGGEATAEEIADFWDKQNSKFGELSDAELEQVVGGKEESNDYVCSKCGCTEFEEHYAGSGATELICKNCGYIWN